MQRDLTPAEQAAIEQQVIAKIKAEKPDITRDEAKPIYDQMLGDALKLAQATPPQVSGGVIARHLKSIWDTTLGAIGSIPGMAYDMAADAGPNFMREMRATMDVTDPEPAILHAAKAIPFLGQFSKAVGQGAVGELEKAGEEYKQGNYVPAALRATLGVLPAAVPGAGLIAPAIGATYDKALSGDMAGATGEMVGNFLVPELIPQGAKIPVVKKLLMQRPNAEEAAMIGRQLGRGYPMDLASATGNPMVELVERVGGESTLGSLVVGPKKAADQAVTLTKAEELANEASGLRMQGPMQENVARPGVPKFSEAEAGREVDKALLDKRNERRAAGREGYSDTEMYGALADPEWVPIAEDLTPARQAKIEHSLGRKIDVKEAQELRRILVEMEEQPNIQTNWTPTRDRSLSNHPSGEWIITGGGAGAPVFDDINNAMPSRNVRDMKTGEVSQVQSSAERAEIIASLKKALSTGVFGLPARAAMKVVEDRLANPQGQAARSAALPPSAGIRLKEWQVPVDVTEAKNALRPEYERELNLRKSAPNPTADPAFDALHRFMQGEDVIDAITLDKVVSNFKRLGRGGKEVRDANAMITQGQRLAFQASSAIDPVLIAKAETIPGMAEALKEARGNWQEASRINSIRKDLTGVKGNKAPETLFRQLSGTTATKYLEQLRSVAPEAIQQVAKAKLDDINKLAFSGNPTAAKQALGQFRDLGPEAQKILFPDAEHLAALKDLYEYMAIREKNVNPSGSFLGAAKWKEVGSLASTALLGTAYTGSKEGLMLAPVQALLTGAVGVMSHSTKVAKLLSQGKSIPLANKAAMASWAKLLQAAVEEAQQQDAEKGVAATGMPSYPSGQGNVTLPAEGARDPRLPPPQ